MWDADVLLALVRCAEGASLTLCHLGLRRHVAADQGLPEAIKLLAGNGARVNVPREEDQRTPLHIAVNEGHLEVCASARRGQEEGSRPCQAGLWTWTAQPCS